MTKAREAPGSEQQRLSAAARRIVKLLEECQLRHESLHRMVMAARGVFLAEQERQSFRPPTRVNLPDSYQDVLLPLLELGHADAEALSGCFVTDMGGPHPPHLPRLYRLINDLWTGRHESSRPTQPEDPDDVLDPPPPLIRPEIIDVAVRAVRSTGLPARLSALIAACLTDAAVPATTREQGAEVLNLAVLWAFSPENPDDDEGRLADDLMAQILGPRAAADSDGTPLRLPGWDGDDVIVVADSDAFATAVAPPAVIRIHEREKTSRESM